MIRNLTPHAVQIYAEAQFTNLEQINPTTWVADGVEGEPLQSFPSDGVARLTTSVEPQPSLFLKGEVVRTMYGQITGLPDMCDLKPGDCDYFIVSLPLQSGAKAMGHLLSERLVCPYKVVRSRANGSLVLGAMGFTF